LGEAQEANEIALSKGGTKKLKLKKSTGRAVKKIEC